MKSGDFVQTRGLPSIERFKYLLSRGVNHGSLVFDLPPIVRSLHHITIGSRSTCNQRTSVSWPPWSVLDSSAEECQAMKSLISTINMIWCCCFLVTGYDPSVQANVFIKPNIESVIIEFTSAERFPSLHLHGGKPSKNNFTSKCEVLYCLDIGHFGEMFTISFSTDFVLILAKVWL